MIRFLFLLLLLPSPIIAAELFDETKVKTLFAFDNGAIPHTQNLRLEMRQPVRHEANPVVKRGKPGTPDAHGVQFYGSVIRDGGKYRMWYVAFDDAMKSKVASERWRAAYAESADGVNWTKPNLGLVEFGGNKNNNLVDVGAAWGFVNLKVIKDEADPDATRRYKMTTHVYFRHHRYAAAGLSSGASVWAVSMGWAVHSHSAERDAAHASLSGACREAAPKRRLCELVHH